jgi:nucleoside transporter
MKIAAMSFSVRARLSAMMFLQFFIWGAWFVTLSTYLGRTLTFSGVEIGRAYSTMPWGAIVAPLIVGIIADRLFRAERVLAVLHLMGAVLLWWAASVRTSDDLFWILLAYALCYNPTLALVNAVAFYQMQEPEREFPSIRVFGTMGWIVAGLIVGFAAVEATSIPLQVAAATSLLLAVFALCLPATPPSGAGRKFSIRDALGLDALALLRERSFAVFIAASLLICIPLAFYYNFANLFLNEAGLGNAAGKMTLGQVSEFFFMLVMPFCFARLGVKWMLLVAMCTWALRYVLFAFGNASELVWMFYVAILLHGVCYDFFFVTGQIYVDKAAPPHLRASTQGFITLITYGVGMLIGAEISGRVVSAHTLAQGSSGAAGHEWTAVWLVPASMAVVVGILFLLCFRTDRVRTGDGVPDGAQGKIY